jgi:DNA recombination protein RmuC
MSETLFFLILLIFGGLILTLLFFLIKINEKLKSQIETNVSQQKEIQEIKEKILVGEELQKHFKDGINKTKEILQELQLSDKLREEKEKEFLESIKRIDRILAGSATKGASGEEILWETFKKLPPKMIERNFHLKGKVVEFALILPNGKRVPIDSKWPASNLVLKLEEEKDPEERKEIIDAIEKEVMKKIKEVKEYIDPTFTWSQALIALPDSVYQVCQEAHLRAQRENIILLPYSMVLPLVLYIYRLHLEYGVSIDKEVLKSYLSIFQKNLAILEEILENKIIQGTKMIQNATLEYRSILGEMKTSIHQIEKGEIMSKSKK